MMKREDPWTINTMILSAGLVQMLLRNPKTQMRNSQSLCVARNSSIYILTSGYIHSSGFTLSLWKKMWKPLDASWIMERITWRRIKLAKKRVNFLVPTWKYIIFQLWSIYFVFPWLLPIKIFSMIGDGLKLSYDLLLTRTKTFNIPPHVFQLWS